MTGLPATDWMLPEFHAPGKTVVYGNERMPVGAFPCQAVVAPSEHHFVAFLNIQPVAVGIFRALPYYELSDESTFIRCGVMVVYLRMYVGKLRMPHVE